MIYDLMELTWLELKELNKEKLALMLPIAPIEEHSKHLPLGVDCYLTESWVNGCLLKEEKFNWIKVPMQTIGCSEIKGFPGNMHISQNTLAQYVYELLKKYVSWGIKNIVVISGHADPKHAIAIEKACEKVNKEHGNLCFAPMGAIFSGNDILIKSKYYDRLNEMFEQYPNDFHAGWIETSIMLYLMKNKVKENYRDIESIEIKKKDMMFSKRVNKKIECNGHIGYPSFATEELGELLQNKMIDILINAIHNFLDRGNYECYSHHFLYKIKFLHPKKIKGVK